MRLETSSWYALGPPLYAVLLLGERSIARRRGFRTLEPRDAIANLTCGVGQLLFGLFAAPFVLALYDLGYAHRVFTFSAGSPWAWVVAVFGIDACYYAYHRGGHRIALFWAIHEVHHQSERLDISVALRQPWISDLYAIPFYAVLPLIGVPAVQFFAGVALLSVYQIVLHTEVISWPGFGVFNTPKLHAVHHAKNARYLDKNFGATLIVWDRLFGTYERASEDEPPVYGLPGEAPIHNGVRAQLRPFLSLARTLGTSPSLRALVGPPRSSRAPAPRHADPSSSTLPPRTLYAFGFLMALSFALLWGRATVPLAVQAILAALLIFGFSRVGDALEAGVRGVPGEPGHG